MATARAVAALALVAWAGAASSGTYTLRRGDTLGAVARRLGVILPALVAANGIADPNRVRAGQILRIPGATTPAPPPAPA
ncbi:MAG: LysM peptidoglycan-binding domain-containing protein, partial [Acidimicrobiales bacterium]